MTTLGKLWYTVLLKYGVMARMMGHSYRDLMASTAMPKVRHIALPLPDTDTDARVMLLLPPGMIEALDGEEEEFRFPLVVNV